MGLRGDAVPSHSPGSKPLRKLHGILWCYLADLLSEKGFSSGGLTGFLNRMRFAINPEENAFYFGAL
jgi:hypothetical protein